MKKVTDWIDDIIALDIIISKSNDNITGEVIYDKDYDGI